MPSDKLFRQRVPTAEGLDVRFGKWVVTMQLRSRQTASSNAWTVGLAQGDIHPS